MSNVQINVFSVFNDDASALNSDESAPHRILAFVYIVVTISR